MDKITAFLDQVPGWLQPIGFAISVISLIASGILMQTGSEGQAKSKKMIAYALIGIAVIFLAASIAASVRGAAE